MRFAPSPAGHRHDLVGDDPAPAGEAVHFHRKVADGLIARWPTSCSAWTIARAPVVDHFAAAVEFMIGDAADGDAYVVAIHPDRQ
jgi:hypothetical protein